MVGKNITLKNKQWWATLVSNPRWSLLSGFTVGINDVMAHYARPLMQNLTEK